LSTHIRLTVLLLLLILAAACSREDRDRADQSLMLFTRVTDGPLVTEAASTGGVSWVDFDGDDDLDLFVTNGYDVNAQEPQPQKNRLYLNNGDGTFAAQAHGPLVEDEGFSSGSTWGDFDNDGDLDVFVSNQRQQNNFLYRNQGDGSFVRVKSGDPVTDGGASFSSSWVDADGDGLLDLWVANGGLSQSGPNFLYRNGGEGTFTKIRQGSIVTDEGRSGGAVWGDYDNDGDPDLFVPNLTYNQTMSNNALYRNDGAWQFTKIERGSPVDDGLPSICASWGDYDNDGDLDLYVGNLVGMANLLYRNDGEGRLTQIEVGPMVVDGGATSAVNWADVDNDGDLDLLAGNWGAAAVLYANLGDGRFVRADTGDLSRHVLRTSSLAWGDYDGDGDLDLYVGNWPNVRGAGELNALYRNDSEAGNWLQIDLRGTTSNHSAIGARVLVGAQIRGELTSQLREVTGHTGWRSQNSLRQHVGLGDATVAEEVEVRWPSGSVERVERVAVNQVIELTEGQGLSRGKTVD
jgi:hypothetical protein